MKKNIKKTVFLLAMAMAIAGCIGCSEMNSGYDNVDGFFYAKVENASKYTNVVEVKLMVHDRSINKYVKLAHFDWKNGGFTIELPETLDPNYFDTLIRGDMWPTRIVNMTPNISISNENVKVSDVYFVGVDKYGNVIATFSPVNIVEDGYTEAIFTYVDSDVTISGYTYGEGHAYPACPECPSWFVETTTYSVEWEKGWNIWFFSRSNTIEGHVIIYTEQWSNTSVSGLKWYGSEENLWRF